MFTLLAFALLLLQQVNVNAFANTSIILHYTCTSNDGTCTAYNIVPMPDRLNRVNHACDFDGISSYINCGNVASAEQIRTISVWVKFRQFAGEIVSKSEEDSGFELLFFGEYLSTYLMGHNTYNINTGYPISLLQLNTWYHIVATHGGVGNELRLYINGALVSATMYSQTQITDAPNVMIGNWNTLPRLSAGNRFFSGVIDDIMLFNVQLSNAEVADLFTVTQQDDYTVPPPSVSASGTVTASVTASASATTSVTISPTASVTASATATVTASVTSSATISIYTKFVYVTDATMMYTIIAATCGSVFIAMMLILLSIWCKKTPPAYPPVQVYPPYPQQPQQQPQQQYTVDTYGKY